MPNISIAYTLPQNGRVSLPVDSSSLVYSHFKHVTGVPAQEGTQGITINRLHLLDVLIGRLNQIQTDSVSPNISGGMDTSQLDALIDSYRGQIEQANNARAAMPYFPSQNTAPGALFNLTI